MPSDNLFHEDAPLISVSNQSAEGNTRTCTTKDKPGGRSFGAARRLGPALAIALGGAMFGPLNGPAAAQMMLYENRLPDGFAYVRFVNTLPEAVTVKPVGFGDPVALGKGESDRVSAYYTVEKVTGRRLEIDLTGTGTTGHATFELKPAAFHTILIGREPNGASAKVVTDQAEMNQNRARLAFYNAVPGCVSATLQTASGGPSVFTGIASGAMRGRSVNPSSDVRLKAACGANPVAASLNVGRLEAGGQYSIWLMAPSGTPVAFLSENAIAPYLR